MALFFVCCNNIFTNTSYLRHRGSTRSKQMQGGNRLDEWILLKQALRVKHTLLEVCVSKNRACGLVGNTLHMDGGTFQRKKNKTSHVLFPFDHSFGYIYIFCFFPHSVCQAPRRRRWAKRRSWRSGWLPRVNARGRLAPATLQVTRFLFDFHKL